MRIQRSPFPNSPPRATAALVILIALGISVLSADTSTTWIEVHPPAIKEMAGIELIHFTDADTGWTEARNFLLDTDGGIIGKVPSVLLRTSDGGHNWDWAGPPDIFYDYRGYRRERTHFVSPIIGWKLGDDALQDSEPNLAADIEIYHSTDGGATWQLRRGKVTELVWLSEVEPIPPIERGRRLHSTHIHFINEQHGWLIGYTGFWWQQRGDKESPLGGNFLCSTRDGGNSWKCRIHPYPWFGLKGDGPEYRLPTDIDFVNRRAGWIAPRREWMYRTTDGGLTWELTSHPHPLFGDVYITAIDFVDESRGWAIGAGAWFTDDGGQSWTQKLSGRFSTLYADVNGVWVAEFARLSTDDDRQTRIYRTEDNGDSWQLEWTGIDFLTYIGYHEVTHTLWAGGWYGVILRRTSPITTAVTSEGRLATLWGKLKAGQNTNR